MRILVHYPFAAEQVDELRAIAAGDGHELKFAEDEDEAADLVADCECLLGFFSEKVTAAAPQLRWIQSFSAGMDNFLYAEIIDREQVEVSNTAGLFAPQGGEHVWALLLALTTLHLRGASFCTHPLHTPIHHDDDDDGRSSRPRWPSQQLRVS